ncbi:hypothetical protein HII36_02175 [Nonomuraea sp. NN258]|uniref:hypothetical protein n=1 Tax=Nonomuraea antri TaxID=2730852 RepID=UPI001568EDFA|nr:hypothetical protein [Nonomuraea antri]NRQ30649.1 hypothetical protein [Nonomuraea antri]
MTTNTVGETNATLVEFNPEGTAAKVWEALNATPGTSTATIAEAAGVSRPTAVKSLAVFAEAGRAVRTPGGRTDQGRALADTWAPVTSDAGDQDNDVPATSDPTPEASTALDVTAESLDVPAPRSAISLQDAMRILAEETDRRTAAEAELARAQAEEEARRQQAAMALSKARMIEDTRQALTDLLGAVTTTYAALLADDEAAFTTGLEAIYTGTSGVRKAARVAPPKTVALGGSSRGDRNAPRPLRPDVLAHLAKHPDLAFTANEIAKVLGRSSGAVANALDTLTRNGEAELVGERPNRFRAAPQDA